MKLHTFAETASMPNFQVFIYSKRIKREQSHKELIKHQDN